MEKVQGENSEPPAKKQRTDEDEEPSVEKVNTILKSQSPNGKKTKSKVMEPMVENKQFIAENYRGALLEYLQKQGKDSKVTFETKPRDEKIPPVFISTCKACDVTATGEGSTKKQAIKEAALAVIQKMQLVPPSWERPKGNNQEEAKVQEVSKKKEVKPIVENLQYLNGNFRGALQEYIVKQHPSVILEFTTELQLNSNPGVFIAKCKAVEGENEEVKAIVGTGHAGSKKSAIQFSALEFMLKLNLLTEEQHNKVHNSKGIPIVDSVDGSKTEKAQVPEDSATK